MIFKNSKKYECHPSMRLYSNLSEGLIHSYNFNKCEKYLKVNFPFIKSILPSKIHPLNGYKLTCDESTHFYFIKIDKNFNEYKKMEDVMNNLCGWYISKVTLYYKDVEHNNPNIYIIEFNNSNNGFIDYSGELCLDNIINDEDFFGINIVQIEFLCQEKFTVNVYDIPEFLYHGTFSNLNRIKKYGLVPQNRLNHPDRVYFGKSERVVKQLFNYNKDVIILRILNKNKKYKIWVDYNHRDCYYTLDNINPNDIEIKINNEWNNLTKFEKKF